MKSAIIGFMCLFATCQIKYKAHQETPTAPQELREFIAAKEAELDGLEGELEEAKKARDTVARAAEDAEGYFQREDANRRLSMANIHVSFLADDITDAKKQLAAAKARLADKQESE